MASYRAVFQADERSLQALASHWPGLTIEPCDAQGAFWVGGAPLDLSKYMGDYRSGLAEFTSRANCIIALNDCDLSGISSLGSLEIIDGQKVSRVCLVEPAILEISGVPIVLAARGTTRPVRPMNVRADELLPQDDRFRRATSIFATCGTDMRELFKVVELIERAHGGLPKKRSKEAREKFFTTLNIDPGDWEALHRSFRPERHAEPHDLDGRRLNPRLARILIQHALKLWLTRAIPE